MTARRIELALWWRYGLGQAYRISLRERPEKTGGAGVRFTYGETPRATAGRLLDRAALSTADRFLELGAGIGRVSLLAASRGASAEGIEQVPTFVRNASRIAERLSLPARFRCADLFTADWSSATVLYITPTAFSAADLARLEACYATIQPGARLISLTEPPKHPGFELLSMDVLDFSWGPATVFVHQKSGPERS